MIRIALKMLMGDAAKFFGVLLGLSLTSFLITWQMSVFLGLLTRTFSTITDTGQPDVWVMDKKVQFIDDLKPMIDTQLLRVRSIQGVQWVVPLYKGLLKARLADGTFQTCNMLGLDDSSLIGGPPVMLEGTLADLRKSDGVIVDDIGAAGKLAHYVVDEEKAAKKGLDLKTTPPELLPKKAIPLKIGDTLELSDRRAVVVGICRVGRTFQSQPVIYTTYTRAVSFAPKERKLMSFVLVKAEAGQDPAALARRISAQTDLGAYTREEFKKLTWMYFMKNTGIPINFGFSVLLGFIVGTAIAGMTFYSFTRDNLRYLGALKAMGTSNWTLLRMITFQALVVGVLGWGLGVGAGSGFYFIAKRTELAYFMPWHLLVGSGVAVCLICVFSAAISLTTVIRLEPAVVFRS